MALMPAHEYLQLDDKALLAQCEVHAYRASGPGGQKRNKTSSAVRLHHQSTGLISKGAEDRSQHVNKKRALRRLRMTLATELLGTVDLADYAASARLVSCVDDGRLDLRLKDQRALLVINEVLSLLQSSGGRLGEVGRAIGVSTGNLVKFLKIDLRVWRKVSHIRRSNKLNSLKNAS